MATYAELERQLVGMSRRVSSFASDNQRLFTIVMSIGGQMLGGFMVGFTGYIERRWPQKDGSPFSIGPVPLSQCNAVLATIASVVIPPGIFQQAASHTASAFWGSVTGTYGRAWGAASRARAIAAKGPAAVAGAPYNATPYMYQGARDIAALGADDDDDDDDDDHDHDDALTDDERALFGG